MRGLRITVLSTTAVVALAGLTACSSSGTAGASGTAAKKAVSTPTTAPAGSAVASVADALSLATTKTASYNSMKVKVTEIVPKVGTITASGTTSRKPLSMDLTMSNPQLTQELGATSMHVLMAGTTMYMDMGAAGAAELGGKHWMKMDFTTLGASGKALADSMNQSSGQDPSDVVKLVTSSGDVKKVGQETVDGVATTHYAGVVDMKQLAAQESKDGNSSFKTLVDQAGTLGMTTETVNLWVDSRNLPVKAHETAKTSQGAIDITIDYSDFSNTPLTITPPPASDTLDFATLLQQAKTG